MTLSAEGLRFGERTQLTFSRDIDRLEDVMQFRLTYEGELKARGGGLPHKHRIRQSFHRQLKRFWDVHPGLAYWKTAKSQAIFGAESSPQREWSHHDWLAENYRRGSYRFVPLAREFWRVIVSLDILFLRSGKPGEAIRAADLDGRLKTLIDALRLPTEGQEMTPLDAPSEGEDPFYGLMEDDRLVGNVAVTTDTLLEPTPNSNGIHDTHDSRVVIAVTLKSYGDSFGSPFV
jgi:hypothetical protein